MPPLDMSKHRERGRSEAIVAPPTPPRLDETMIESMIRRGSNQAAKILGPASEATSATLRSGFNTGTFGATNYLEGLLSGDPEKTDREARIARERFPKASATGDAAAAIAQTVPASKLLGLVAPALRAARPVTQAANQAIVGGVQGGAQNIYESFRDDRPVNPGGTLLSAGLGTGLGFLGGGLASKVARGTAPGLVSQTLPNGLSAAERTAIANQVQRGASHGADIDLPTAMRLANTPGAPIVERQLQRGSTASGVPVGRVPDRFATNLDQAESSLARSEADTVRQTSGLIAQAERDLARLEAAAAAERTARATPLRGRTSPRVEEIRKQIMDEKRLGLNPNPPGRLSPEIYDEVARRLTDLGETGEVETLRRMLDRALPAGIPAREARGQLDNLTMNGLPPSPATQAARGQLDELREVEGAIVNRPVAPEPPRSARGREISGGLGGWGSAFAPHFRYRGPGGPAAPGPTVERAAQMLRNDPNRAAGILGQVRPWEAPAAAIPAEGIRAVTEPILEGILGVGPPPSKRKRTTE